MTHLAGLSPAGSLESLSDDLESPVAADRVVAETSCSSHDKTQLPSLHDPYIIDG